VRNLLTEGVAPDSIRENVETLETRDANTPFGAVQPRGQMLEGLTIGSRF